MAIKQNFDYELSLWRPTTRRITDEALWAAVTQVNGRSYVSIPVTSEAVYRNERTAAYLQPTYRSDTYGIVTDPVLSTTGTLTVYPYKSTMPQLGYGPVCERNVHQLTYCPFQNIYGADHIGSRFLLNYYTRNTDEDLVFSNPTSFQNFSYGIFPQVIVGTEPDFYNDHGSGTYRTTQDVWILSGLSAPASAPLGTARVVEVQEKLAENSISSATVTAFSSAIFQNMFAAACVIESDAYNKHLFMCGGFSTYPGTIISQAYAIRRDGTLTKDIGTAPYNVGKAACIFNKKHGVVVVTGGATTSGSYATNTGATWDPQTEVWNTITGTLKTARRDHKMVALNDEDILIIGGRTGSLGASAYPNTSPLGVPLNQCEIITIDGLVNSFAPRSTGSMATARFGFGMTTLPDGRVLVCGGIGVNPSYPVDPSGNESTYELKSCEVYQPETGQWTSISDMNSRHSYCVCSYIELLNRVYVYGGLSDSTIEYLDLETMEWHLSTTSISGVIGFSQGVKACETVLLLPGGSTAGFGSARTGCNAMSPWNINESIRTDGFNGHELTIKEYDGATPNISGYIKNEQYLGNFVSSLYPLESSLTDHGDEMEAFKAPPTTIGLGAYAWNLEQAFGVSTPFTLNQNIQRGFKYNQIEVTTVFDIPSGTNVIFNYGFANQTGPVKTFGLQGTKLQLDPGFVFEQSIPTGSTINVVTNGTYQPANNSGLGQFWLTASNAAREVCIDTLKAITAAGIKLDIETRYPGDRGLGNEGYPLKDNYKISEIVHVYGRDDLSKELEEARNGI